MSIEIKTTRTVRTLRGIAVGTAIAVMALLAGAGIATAASPVFALEINHGPTNLVPGKEAEYRFTVQNLSATPTSGPVTLSVDSLPEGLTATGIGGTPGRSSSAWSCDLPSMTCSTEASFAPGRILTDLEVPRTTSQITLRVAVDPDATGTKLLAATVSGGGANPVTTEVDALVSEQVADFGIVPGSFKAEAYDREGNPVRQAGEAPFIANVAFELAQRLPLPGESSPYAPVDRIRGVWTKLPKGLIGSPAAAPACPSGFFMGGDGFVSTDCPIAAQVGTIDVSVINLGGSPSTFHAPVYNLEPWRGIAAVFGFKFSGATILVVVRDLDPSDHSVIARVGSVNEAMPVLAQHLTLWGNPADPLHDADRAVPGASDEFPGFWGIPSPIHPAAFLRMPTECNAGGTNFLRVDSWENPGLFTSPQISPNPPAEMSGCDRLEFEPEIDVKPTTNLADGPSGLEFKMRIPQNQDPEGLATAHLRDATVTLPAGMTVNPPSADGLGACAPSQIGLTTAVGNPNAKFTNNASACPDASKLGRVEVETPVLDRILPGDVYLAQQNNNPFNSLIAIYAVIDDPESDVIVKLAGKVTPDPVTGQLTATFKENPQMPVEELRMKFFEGPRAALKTPSTCGSHTTTSTLVPWSSPEAADATPSSSFELTQGPSGGACLKAGGGAPNTPAFDAGTIDPTAKAFSPFVLRLARADGTQQIRSIDTTLPTGLTAKLAGVSYCSDAALGAAAGRSGKAEQNSPSCPAASRVGSVKVGSGAGSTPLYVGAQAYLAGPYKGAPLSLAIVTPAVAGPFDLGTVVVRTALQVNPETAQVRAVSDEIPQILQGIPLNIRSVTLNMDRPEFILNPTSCDPMTIDASALSVFNQSAPLSSRFQVGECNKLGFKPKLAIRFSGAPPRRGGHPKLSATLTMPPGGANIARGQVTMPGTEFLENAHIRTICTRVQYAAKACPKGSVYGYAKAWTPLLDQPLEGPVYLRSSSNKLPDLVASLDGQIHFDLVGRITSPNARIRNTFDLVPDAPVSKFVLTMQGGKKGLLVNSTNLCKAQPRVSALFEAQNGKVAESEPMVKVAGCGKKKRK